MKIRVAIWFIGFLVLCCSPDKSITVGIQPFDNFDEVLSDTVASALKKTYGVSVVILPLKPLPPSAFTNVKVARYRADKIIWIIKNEKPDTIDYIVGLTDNDISTTKTDLFGNTKAPASKYEDWGIFGLGFRPGPSCVISTYRIKNTTRSQFLRRLQKISIHELGHNLGLDHCDSQLCVMRDAVETINTIDQMDKNICMYCRNKLVEF